MIPWIEADETFPSVEDALRDPNGLLCAGLHLSPQRVLEAYKHGIFPWFNEGDPVLWWSPDPRMVLFPSEFKISRSLRKALRAERYRIKLDARFDEVVAACGSTPRKGQDGTWITEPMQAVYGALHELGFAHSVETWVGDTLVGGLYGLAIGRMFYGESMFSHATDASKIALAHLVKYLENMDFGLIDCQMNTRHLASLGAREIPRHVFIAEVRRLTTLPPPAGRWPADAAQRDWR
ncbi:leucyl/phenylalanyl-tRNA--protein transferase [Propionivibrio soli]|uniref:leucyl/phenylalanyl-tRNA--protein transferase n=1 Tax=Propionivibrio soli TaxID=2976531 RepID=UPI0021E80BA8|nr:leucyl/phenylalanyl-tRNA--protein transferase [Propionivibrio soli]